MNETPLFSVADLAARLDDPRCIVVDCRFDLMQPEAGREAYQRGHIPGAWYADLDQDLAAAARSNGGGRHPLPSATAFRHRLDDWGAAEDGWVVAYDDAGGAIAARLWWLLRWFGFAGARVLDGGWQAWQAVDGRVDQSPPRAGPGGFAGGAGCMPVVGADDVASGIADASLCLIDARAANRFAGDVEPIDARAGHVPGALNLPFGEHLGSDGKFLSARELRHLYSAAVADRDPGQLACMCGSGVTACHALLALEVAGLSGAALYVGSWSDWISGDRPVATGP